MEEQNTPQSRGRKQKKARRRTNFAPIRSALVTIIACILCIAITAGAMCLMFFNRFGGVANYKMARKLMEVKEVIDQNYIGESDPTAIENSAAAAMEDTASPATDRAMETCMGFVMENRPIRKPSTATQGTRQHR